MKQKQIIYQVLPRLFGNTNETLRIGGTLADNGVGKFADFTPKALKSIKELGCTHLWYTGVIEHATRTDYTSLGIPLDNKYVVKGEAGSPYAIKDYYDVCPDLAIDPTQRIFEFEALVERTRAAGLKTIIDFVPNHVARCYHSDAKPDGVKDFGQEDNTECAFLPQNNFYYIPRQAFAGQIDLGEGGDRYTEYPAKATGNDCFGAYPGSNDWYETVKLNYGVDYQHGCTHHFDPIPDTWHKMLEILLYWSKKGISGFRCDMAEMVPVEFWGWVIPQVKCHYPQVEFIAEVYNPNQYAAYIFQGKFDYLYDKVGLYDLLKGVVAGQAPAERITRSWQSVDHCRGHILNFLENHDEQRIASPYFAGDPYKALPALVVSAMMNTHPFMIYCGQELGEPGMDAEGFSGLDGRTTIFDYWSVDSVRRWNNNGKFTLQRLTASEKKLRATYQSILTLCNSQQAIREGEFFDLMYVNGENPRFDPYRQYAFLRYFDRELVVVVANFSGQEASVAVNIPAHALDLYRIKEGGYFGEELLTRTPCNVKLSAVIPYLTTLPPYGATVVRLDVNTYKK